MHEHICDNSPWLFSKTIERSSQKLIIIGKGGANLKKIREYAELQLSEFLQIPVDIHLFVKVNENWRKKAHALKELGFE